MSNLTCPGCGSVYPLTAVQTLDHFPCAVCHQTIIVPIAGPAPSRAAPAPAPRQQPPIPRQQPPVYQAPAAPPPIARPAAPQAPRPVAPQVQRPAPAQHAPAAHHHPRAHHAPRRESSGPNWGLIGAGGAVLAAIVVGVILITDKKTPVAPEKTANPAKPPAPAVAEAPKADPMKDPDAWKALSASERADRAVRYLSALDRRDGSQLSAAFSFLKARGETEAMRKVADIELARDPSTGWAHQARGDVMIVERIDRCLAECARADEADTPAVQKLTALRKKSEPSSGTWWAGEALTKEIDDVLAAIRAEETKLKDPYEWACAKWGIYQRRIEVMRDHPAITGTTGPYLVFVQVKAPAGTSIDAVSPDEMTRARRVLNQHRELFGAVYEGFHAELGKQLGVAPIEKAAIDEKTLLKANVFADQATWELYHQRLGFLPWAQETRAYYDYEEPRFLATFDGGSERPPWHQHLQCCEAVRQLLHFYTWDVTRKAAGRELAWLDCRTRPIWLEVGFGEFFASHKQEGGRFTFMQPLDLRMRDLWVFSQVFQKKRWANWTLDELLTIVSERQIDDQAKRRVVPKPVKQLSQQQLDEVNLAIDLMRPLFYARAWSLVDFLWNQTDAGGRPVYRDRFCALIKQSLTAEQTTIAGRGLTTRMLGSADFRKALGVESEEAYRALEREWYAWESGRTTKGAQPAWTSSRDAWFKKLGLK